MKFIKRKAWPNLMFRAKSITSYDKIDYLFITHIGKVKVLYFEDGDSKGPMFLFNEEGNRFEKSK